MYDFLLEKSQVAFKPIHNVHKDNKSKLKEEKESLYQVFQYKKGMQFVLMNLKGSVLHSLLQSMLVPRNLKVLNLVVMYHWPQAQSIFLAKKSNYLSLLDFKMILSWDWEKNPSS